MSSIAGSIMRGVWIAAEQHDFDEKGYTTNHWLFPETAEIIYGGLASLIVFALLYKYGRKPVADGMKARTDRVQGEIEASAAAQADADADVSRIRLALGDVQAERQRLLAQADAQAAALLADGRTRLDAEVADLEAKSDADIAAVAERSSDELRNEIARLASRAADTVVADSLDDATQQRLIEDFIAKVGASA